MLKVCEKGDYKSSANDIKSETDKGPATVTCSDSKVKINKLTSENIAIAPTRLGMESERKNKEHNDTFNLQLCNLLLTLSLKGKDQICMLRKAVDGIGKFVDKRSH